MSYVIQNKRLFSKSVSFVVCVVRKVCFQTLFFAGNRLMMGDKNHIIPRKASDVLNFARKCAQKQVTEK